MTATEERQIRLLMTDTDGANPIFTQTEVEDFFTLENDNVKRAAALGLETIASNEVLVMKVISLLDLSTNGAAESSALLERAAILRQTAIADEAAGAFDWTPI